MSKGYKYPDPKTCLSPRWGTSTRYVSYTKIVHIHDRAKWQVIHARNGSPSGTPSVRTLVEPIVHIFPTLVCMSRASLSAQSAWPSHLCGTRAQRKGVVVSVECMRVGTLYSPLLHTRRPRLSCAPFPKLHLPPRVFTTLALELPQISRVFV